MATGSLNQRPLPLRPAGAPVPRPTAGVLPRPSVPGARPSQPMPLSLEA